MVPGESPCYITFHTFHTFLTFLTFLKYLTLGFDLGIWPWDLTLGFLKFLTLAFDLGIWPWDLTLGFDLGIWPWDSWNSWPWDFSGLNRFFSGWGFWHIFLGGVFGTTWARTPIPYTTKKQDQNHSRCAPADFPALGACFVYLVLADCSLRYFLIRNTRMKTALSGRFTAIFMFFLVLENATHKLAQGRG